MGRLVLQTVAVAGRLIQLLAVDHQELGVVAGEFASA